MSREISSGAFPCIKKRNIDVVKMQAYDGRRKGKWEEPALKERKFSIYKKIRNLFFGALIPITAINIIMNQVANMRIQQQGAEKMEAQLASKVINFDNELGRINAGLRFHVLNGEEAFLATNYYSLSSYQLGQKVAELNARLNELALISDCIEDVAVFMPHIERVVSFLNYYEDTITENDMERILQYRYKDNGNVYNNGKLLIHMVAPTSDEKEPLYIMEAALSNNKILSFIKGGEDEGYALAGDDWVISEPAFDIPGPALEKIRRQTEESGSFVVEGALFCYHRLSLCDGWMISYTEISNLIAPVRIFHVFMFITLFVTIIVILLVICRLSQSVNRPFQQLLYLFREVETGTLDVKTNYHFKDEFAVVFEQFDSMISRIKELLSQSVKQGKELQLAEYKQLQAHIAPHFLYNSFNVLRHCILMEDYETASEMTGLLGNYFRYMTYSGEQESIPLLEEYRHAGDYLDIQKIRFQDNITVEMDELPEKYNYFRVPPFILQPLVENVFKHGIKDMAYAGCISVRVEETETKLCLIVRDNGYGISQQELEKLRRGIEGTEVLFEHSGLVNIGKRLKILLGEGAGLAVNSELNQFFEAVIYIPLEASRYAGQNKEGNPLAAGASHFALQNK